MFVMSLFANLQLDQRNGGATCRSRPVHTMYVTCLQSEWTSLTEREIRSFVAVTDEPAPELAVAGRDRCIVNLWIDGLHRKHEAR